ncbi:hypothetical protein DRP77_08615, partial [Candidatus Poribacteria bacterium]
MRKAGVVLGLLLLISLPSSPDVQILSSTQNGILFRFSLPPVKVEEVERGGRRFDQPFFEGCGFILDGGLPRLPIRRLAFGVPPDVQVRLELIDRSTRSIPIGSPLLNPGPPKRLGGTFPESEARIALDGFIRSQRIAVVELCPVRYDPISRSLILHPEMTVKLTFIRPSSAPPARFGYVREPEPFEQLLKESLLNYEEARLWRKPPPRVPSPAPQLEGEKLKIYVERTGLYRLTAEELKEEWGVDLSGVDPRTFSLSCGGEEVPIYVKGEEDGRFDPGDYIEFLGVNPKRPYTRYNIYWLSWGKGRGLRVGYVDGEPRIPGATFPTSFRSKIRLEEDHLHSTLKELGPDKVCPDEPEMWYERVDHWFWTGIKNRGDQDEVRLPFKLFDVAQSFSRPKITVALQGGTPVEHDVLVMVNGIRIGRARWSKQDRVVLSKTLPANAFIDATQGDNVLSCLRIDTSEEPNATVFPYHVYINWIELEYMRLYRAVRDALDFSTPEEREVEKGELLEFAISCFLRPDVDVFIHDGERLVAMIKNPLVERVKLDEAERERFR